MSKPKQEMVDLLLIQVSVPGYETYTGVLSLPLHEANGIRLDAVMIEAHELLHSIHETLKKGN
jgi:hypothetical protein